MLLRTAFVLLLSQGLFIIKTMWRAKEKYEWRPEFKPLVPRFSKQWLKMSERCFETETKKLLGWNNKFERELGLFVSCSNFDVMSDHFVS